MPFSPVFRDGIADIGGADIGIPLPGKYKVLNDFRAYNRIKAKNASAIINFDVSDDIRLRSITGYTDFFFSNRSDGDGGPAPFSEFYFITEAETLTQEFQIQSANAQSPLQYTLGAFYMDDKIGEGAGTIFSGTNYTTVTAAANGLPVLYGNGGSMRLQLLAVQRAVLVQPEQCWVRRTARAQSRHVTKSYAGYGQISYTIGEKLTLTAGARYTVDDKDYRSVAQAGAISRSSGARRLCVPAEPGIPDRQPRGGPGATAFPTRCGGSVSAATRRSQRGFRKRDRLSSGVPVQQRSRKFRQL